jgi:hypothetical protein
MANFSKETQEFFLALGEDRKKFITGIPNSADRMTPGVLLIFRYYRPATNRTVKGVNESTPETRQQYVVLIVKTRRGDGCFPGKDGKKLVSCFKLAGKSDVIIDTIVENLYKKRRRSSYYGKIKKSLVSILGKDSFRTFKLDMMREVYKLNIKKRQTDG